MRVLITGASGQLGKDLVSLLSNNHHVLGTTRNHMDICNEDACDKIISEFIPDVIIHAAAYTAVDKAEIELDHAYRVNAVGTRNVAVAAEKVGAKMCYISTDYVFDGESKVPYHEYDDTNPINIYGKTKRAGERIVRDLSSRYFIVRTSWIYGRSGSNFVKTMLKIGKDTASLKVVSDQMGSPTYTIDLCIFLMELIETTKYGIYHASNQGHCSWFDFASAIFEESGYDVKVIPCTTADFIRPAQRPKFSVMAPISIRTNGFKELRAWREALVEFLKQIKGEGGDEI